MRRRAEKIFVPERPGTPLQHQGGINAFHRTVLRTFAEESLMSSLTLLQSLHENLAGRAQVKSVFGDPVTAGEKTIIPVAKIAYGFGAGAGVHVDGAVSSDSLRSARLITNCVLVANIVRNGTTNGIDFIRRFRQEGDSSGTLRHSL